MAKSKVFLGLLVIVLLLCVSMDAKAQKQRPRQTRSIENGKSDSLRSIESESLPVPYRVEHTFYDDIRDPFDCYSVVFYRTETDTFTIQKDVHKDGSSMYCLAIDYVGDDWRFMDGEVLIEIDGQIFEYEDSEPYRKVMDNGQVLEFLIVYFDDDDFTLDYVAAIKRIRIQCYRSPVIISTQGRQNITRFVAEMEEK